MAATAKAKPQALPNGCTRDRARQLLDKYDSRKNGGYKNQVVAARDQLVHATGMTVTELRKWLVENPAQDNAPLDKLREITAANVAAGGAIEGKAVSDEEIAEERAALTDEERSEIAALPTGDREEELEQGDPAAVVMVAKPDGKTPWHVQSLLEREKTLCGQTFIEGNWHVVEDADPRTVRLKNRPVCVNCQDRLEAMRRRARTTVPAVEGYHGATSDQAQRYLDLHPTGVLAVWIPSDAGSEDIPAAWRIRKDDYGFWLERKTLANDLDNWGIANQMRQSEVKGLLAQLRERNGGAAAFADNDQEGGTKMASTATRKSAARKSAANKKSTTSRRASMTETAAKTDANALFEEFVKSAKTPGVKVVPSKSGRTRYFKVEGKTIGKVVLGGRQVTTFIGASGGTAHKDGAGAEAFGKKIAAAAEKAKAK